MMKTCPSCNETFKKKYLADKYCSFRCRIWELFEVDDNWCWIYKGGKDYDGYGIMSINNKSQKAHRIFWEFFKGPVTEGLQVLHTCDNPSCVKPDHLFLGTNKDNMHDKIKKGRDRVRGEENVRSKVTKEQVLEIRRLCTLPGLDFEDIAERFGIGTANVKSIFYRKTWKEV